MKRMIALFLTALIVFVCVGCGSDASDAAQASETQDPENADLESEAENDESGSSTGTLEGFPWTIELLAAETQDALRTMTSVRQYDGSMMDVVYDDAPTEGKVFLILTLAITKTDSGSGSFAWSQLSIQEPDGNGYARMENDTFLQNHSYTRMAGTPLQIGKNEGSVCFEIPADTAGKALTLRYDAGEAGSIEIPVRTN